MPGVQNVTVSEAEAGQKLLQFLQRRVGRDVPKAAIMKWIRKGEVRVDKGRKKPFDRLKAGQLIRIPPFRNESSTPPTDASPQIEVVHEDSELIVIKKPSGLASHGGDGITDSAAARLKAAYPDEAFSPTLAHRLDRDTSGLLVAARTYSTLRQLNDAFARSGLIKLYLARVTGRWPDATTVMLEDHLEKSGRPGNEKVHAGSGKQARSEVTLIDSDEKESLLAIRLLTGRTHQIRVQLASRGFPIHGDPKYGLPGSRPPLLLHCFGLVLPDLGNGSIQISCPPDWQENYQPSHESLQGAHLLLNTLRKRAFAG
ncbi:RluA family pseudouridine synthase [Desulfovibrio oxyclinae]|uniref:RluA family pseudouridine synthase n=1 Tax=Desulfovibrio oxyclinae TaxID=63560 RepID=UPI00037D3A06|nr:RluA family pseudouridine synthase [Desulfovibrio oxyclinae]